MQSNPKVCIFCEVLNVADGPDNLVIGRGRRTYVILNRYPYTTGHCMIVANAHVGSLEDLESEARGEMIELTARMLRLLRITYAPQAFNIGANIGEAAGAGIAGHVHLHIVPRWTGDTNFMTTLAETRVLPEALEESYRRIRQAWLAESDP
jgi:ATP adenylyltransferase